MPNLAYWVLACLATCIIATLLVKYGGDDDQCRLKADTGCEHGLALDRWDVGALPGGLAEAAL